jgi:hypothetical protein
MNDQPTYLTSPAAGAGRARPGISVSRRLLLTLMIAGALLLGAIGGAIALTNTPTADAVTPTADASLPNNADTSWGGGPWGGGRWGGGPWGPGPGGPLFDRSRTLHGEVVLSKDGGGTETMVIQRGELSEVSATSISVKSADGFARTYAVNSETAVNGEKTGTSKLAKGEELIVSALESGSTLTARHIIH